MVQDRVRRILGDLEAVRENLLGLSDDIWLSIEHNDTQALEEGVQFKRAYNEKMTAFNRLATDLSVLIQQFTSVRLESDEKTGFESERENERIIAELNREEPHTIDEDFTFKRPHGYMLRGQATTGITTWRRLFELFCKQLLREDGDRFRQLPESPNFVSRRGHPSFARSPVRCAWQWRSVTGFSPKQPVGQRHPRRDPATCSRRVRHPDPGPEAVPASGPRCRCRRIGVKALFGDDLQMQHDDDCRLPSWSTTSRHCSLKLWAGIIPRARSR